MEMQQRMYCEINSQQKSATYTAGNHFHHPNKHLEKGNTLTIPANNLLNRGNYHYNYTPNGSTQKLMEKNKHSADSFQLKEKYQGSSSNNQILKPTQNDNDRSYAKYAVSESKHSVQNSKHNNFSFTQNLFPNTFKVMDLSKFIEQNGMLRKRLLNQLNDIRERKNNMHQINHTVSNNQLEQSSKTPQKSINHSRQKLSTYDEEHTVQSIEQKQQQLQQLRTIKQQKQKQIQQQKHQLTELQKKNTIKRQQIQKLQQQMLNQSIHETPLLREKQQAIQYLSVQIEWLNEKTAQLKRLTNNKFAEKNIFEMYEQMCRQCEMLRKDNNKKSEKLKSLFDKTNKLTGKQENVNMFLMNLKV